MVCSLDARFAVRVCLLLCDFTIFADFWLEFHCILGVFGLRVFGLVIWFGVC